MLSKTDFFLYLEAPMHLWAKAHNQIEVDALTPYDQHLAQQGQQVEALAQNYIKQVVLPGYQNAKIYFQKTFNDGRFLSRVDALIWDREVDAYDLFEIKSSTSVKPEHELDLTFQVLLLENLLNLRHVVLLHIDKTYQRAEDLALERFFICKELSEKVENRRTFVAENREIARSLMQLPSPQPGFACHKPQSCPCPSLCHPDHPPHSVYDLPYLGKKAAALREMGVISIHDIPDALEFNPNQSKHIRAVKLGEPLIEKRAIKQRLDGLDHPLYFLDYETVNPAIPLFPGYQPYEHIIFQYVLYVLEKPGAVPLLYEYLHTAPNDPAPEITPHLLNHIGSHGSVIVWNQSFEKHRNLDLARRCPQYADGLMDVNARLFDLMKIFKDGCYVHPDFHGSASLKAVLPVLCPHLSYTDLEIQNGEETMLKWYWLQTGEPSPEERKATEDAMKAYCGLDTLGMVEIYQHLNKIVGGEDGPLSDGKSVKTAR